MTDEQLREFSAEHLVFEINALYSALELFVRTSEVEVKSFGDALQNSQRNINLEAIVLHARVLYQFLYFKKNSNFPDDVLAINFFKDPNQWTSIRPTGSEALDNLCEKAGFQVAHLSFNRTKLDEASKKWNLHDITNDLLSVLILFSEKADPNKLHSDVAKILKFWQAGHGHEPGQTPMSQRHFTVGSTGATTIAKF